MFCQNTRKQFVSVFVLWNETDIAGKPSTHPVLIIKMLAPIVPGFCILKVEFMVPVIVIKFCTLYWMPVLQLVKVHSISSCRHTFSGEFTIQRTTLLCFGLLIAKAPMLFFNIAKKTPQPYCYCWVKTPPTWRRDCWRWWPARRGQRRCPGSLWSRRVLHWSQGLLMKEENETTVNKT